MAWDYDFPKSTPRAVRGGIKAQSKRGAFTQNWWAKRWIEVLEGFDIGSRLQRGRAYARSGQVLDIKIETGRVTAKVQGSSPRPYAVRIRVDTLSLSERARLGLALSEQILFVAKLLANEMPQDIEQVFVAAGLSLFPQRSGDLQTECSCPDWSNPCKHVAAVYYLIGEEFDRDPFLLFKLRGIDREQLLAALDVTAASEAAPEAAPLAKAMPMVEAMPVVEATPAKATRRRKKAIAKSAVQAPPVEPLNVEPLSSEASVFWQGTELPADLLGEAQVPPVTAALPRRLGHFPFWRGASPLLETIEPLYADAAVRGVRLLTGNVMEDDADGA